MSKPTLSPLGIIEETFYQKLKDVPFTVRHYMIALAVLTIIPNTLAGLLFESSIAMATLGIVVVAAWILSRVAGRVLSRRENYDSVLMYRYFAITPWIVGTISTAIALLTQTLDESTRLMYVVGFWIVLAITALHGLGIFIHHNKRKKMTHNIKKEDLFQ